MFRFRQQRIGVYTSDQRRLDNAIVRLDRLEDLLREFLNRPYHIDEYAIDKLIRALAEAVCTQAVAASGRSTILEALRKLRVETASDRSANISAPDIPVKGIRALMFDAMLSEWEKIERERTKN